MLNLDDRLIREVSPKIGPNALSVLLAIAIHLNKKGECFPSHQKLMDLTGTGRDAVYSALDTLVKNGLLKIERERPEKGKFGRRVFHVSTDFISIFTAASEARPLPENPEMDAPFPGKPDTVQPYPDNQGIEVLIKEEVLINTPLPPEGGSETADKPKKKRMPKAKPATAEELLNRFDSPPVAAQIWADFMQLRRDLNKPYKTQRGLDGALKELLEMSEGKTLIARAIVQQSINKEWQGLFPLKQQNHTGRPGPNGQTSTTGQPLSEGDIRAQMAKQRRLNQQHHGN